MRICILSQSRPEIVGGVESYMKSLSLWLSSHHQDVVLVSRGLFKVKAIPSQSVQDRDTRILRVPQPIYQAGLLISSFVVVLKVLHENRQKRIDVIHAVDSGYAGFAGVLASRIIGVPLCYSVHSHRRTLLGGYLRSPLDWLMLSFDFVIERVVYLKASKIIVVGTGLKTYVLSFRIPFKKIVEVPV